MCRGRVQKPTKQKTFCLDDSSLVAQGYMFERLAPSWRHCFRRLRDVSDMGSRLPWTGPEDGSASLGYVLASAFSPTPCEVLSPHTPTRVDNEATDAMSSYHNRLYPLSWDPKQMSPPLTSL